MVPSLTELLIYLGVEVVGRTKFCIHPSEQIDQIPKIGGTKTVDVSKVIGLEPNIVIANKEENVQEQVEAIKAAGIEIYVSEISDYVTALASILEIGKLVNKSTSAEALVDQITSAFGDLPQLDRRVCYLIWRKPYMAAGGDTYINSMLKKCGMTNVYQDSDRYPSIEVADILAKKPDIVMLSSEPFPFKEKHIKELQAHLPDSKIILVDGECYSWYGNRMLVAAEYFSGLVERLGLGS